MTKETYEKLTHSFRKSPSRIGSINTTNKIITSLVYCIYPLLLIWLLLQQDDRVKLVFLVPLVSFTIVSVFRNYINARRPYELLDIVPLISKETKGKSFPSRHVFSIFVIAMAFFYIVIPIGIILLILGTILAAIRVIGGVHFIRDVVAGAFLGILSGIIGFYLL